MLGYRVRVLDVAKLSSKVVMPIYIATHTKTV